ncbi:hypothetical protein Tco_0795150 [Tanacetum coccineum]
MTRCTQKLTQNESLAIAGRNLFDNEASSSNNDGAEPLIPSKTLREHSLPSSAGFQNPITLPAKQMRRIVNSHDISLIQRTCTFQGLKSENPIHHIRHYLSIVDNIRADGATRDTSRLRFFHFSLKGTSREKQKNGLTKFLPLNSQHGISLFYQIDNIPSWGNSRRKEVGENGPDWVVRSKFEDELAGIHEQLSQILSQIRSNETPEPDAPTFAITTRSGTITHDLPYPTLLESITINHAEEMDEKEGPEGEEPGIVQDEESPQQITLYSPSKLSSVPFPSRLKKKKKDEDEERLLSVFKQIHVNLPFLEAMIHMPKGAKVLKDLLSHKEKLEMAASSVKLSKECSGVI